MPTKLKIKLWAYNDDGEEVCILLSKESDIILKESKDKQSTFLKIVGSEKNYRTHGNITEVLNNIEQQIEEISDNEAHLRSTYNGTKR